jgi:hypothetical protein
VEASDAWVGPAERGTARRQESDQIDECERRADLHERRALEHGAQGRIEAARRVNQLGRSERGEALVRLAALEAAGQAWTGAGSGATNRVRRWYGELPEATGERPAAIRQATRQLGAWQLGPVVADALVVIGELIVAASRRGRARVVGLVLRADSLTVEVHNDGAVVAPGRPRHDLVPRATSLALDALATDWGWRPTGTGLALWCQLGLRS